VTTVLVGVGAFIVGGWLGACALALCIAARGADEVREKWAAREGDHLAELRVDGARSLRRPAGADPRDAGTAGQGDQCGADGCNGPGAGHDDAGEVRGYGGCGRKLVSAEAGGDGA
jgi:hypothetical protein